MGMDNQELKKIQKEIEELRDRHLNTNISISDFFRESSKLVLYCLLLVLGASGADYYVGYLFTLFLSDKNSWWYTSAIEYISYGLDLTLIGIIIIFAFDSFVSTLSIIIKSLVHNISQLILSMVAGYVYFKYEYYELRKRLHDINSRYNRHITSQTVDNEKSLVDSKQDDSTDIVRNNNDKGKRNE